MRFSGPSFARFCFTNIPQYLEGDMTKIKSVVVSRTTCAKISGELGLEEFLILGKGMATHPRVPPSVLADVFESLVAAIYLDGGDAAIRPFIEKFIAPGNRIALSRATRATTTSRCCSKWPAASTAKTHLSTDG